MSDQVNSVVIKDTGFIDDVDKYCEIKPSTKFGTPLRSLELVFIKEDSITYKRTQSYTGINNHSGKRWFKITTDFQYCFKVRKLKDGKKYLYVWSIPTNRKVRNYPMELSTGEFNFNSKVNDLVVEFCEKHIGPVPKYLEHLSNDDRVRYYSRPNHVIVSGLDSRFKGLRENKLSLRTSDPNDIMKYLMGPRYSKKLAGLLRGRCSLNYLICLRNLPEIFKTEWLLDYFKDQINVYPDAFFRNFPLFENSHYVSEIVPVGFRKELLEIFLENRYVMNDIFRLYRRIGVTKNSFKEYKNKLSVKSSVLRTEHDRLSELARSIEDKKYTMPYELEPIPENLSELGFRLPTSNKDLSDWSKHFNNCVSGYAREVSNKETLVLNWNDEVCLEVKNKKLKQFLGKYNEKVTPEMFWDGVDILLKYDMIDETPDSSCWGYQEQQAKELANG